MDDSMESRKIQVDVWSVKTVPEYVVFSTIVLLCSSIAINYLVVPFVLHTNGRFAIFRVNFRWVCAMHSNEHKGNNRPGRYYCSLQLLASNPSTRSMAASVWHADRLSANHADMRSMFSNKIDWIQYCAYAAPHLSVWTMYTLVCSTHLLELYFARQASRELHNLMWFSWELIGAELELARACERVLVERIAFW